MLTYFACVFLTSFTRVCS